MSLTILNMVVTIKKAMGNKVKRGNWHRDNRQFVFDYFKGVCQTCKQGITTKWDIHHLHYNYKNILYDTSAKELIENNVITLICRYCHNIEHTAKDITNPKQYENRGSCEICGTNEYGIFGRKIQQQLEKLLCRKCFLLNKNGVIQTIISFID